jgi:acetylornithine aminotransferase/acetylornithine/N-succinyldiaminopimelate aminotransferase
MSPSNNKWLELEDRYLLDTYANMPICIERGQGCYVYDAEGNEYLDMYSGHCVTSTGHCHPKVIAAVQRQVAQLIFYSNATYNSTRARAVRKLVKMCPGGGYRAFFVNSGAEANENAIKLARAVTGRREVISSLGAFHGRTYGSLSATGIDTYREYLNTPVPDDNIVSIVRVTASISEDTAAVILEPIQSMGGVVLIAPEVLRSIDTACRAKGALLIFDEIQTGVGRTGSFLYSEQVGVVPDVTTLAKGIASGYSVGAVLVTEELSGKVKKGDLGSTFGGSPLACAAIRATLEVIESEGLLENAASIGDYLTEHLRKFDRIDEVRGKGLLLGLRFKQDSAREIQEALLDRRILTGGSNDPQVLRLMPALTLSSHEADLFLEAMEKV